MGFCSQPFRTIDILDNHITPCCGAWLDDRAKIQVKPGEAPSPWPTWNHPNLVGLRSRLLDGDFSLCEFCPRLADGDAPEDEQRPAYQATMEIGPRTLNWGLDPSCNLRCWSCRRKVRQEPPPPEAVETFASFMGKFGAGLSLMSASHSGDPFASELYFPWLRGFDPEQFPELKIRIFTNGQLLPTHWPQLGAAQDAIRTIWISIDAATAGTYERLRRGGSWDRLLEALELVAGLRHQRRLDELQLSFVVQADNYLEMPAFVHLGIAYRATRVHFGLLRKMGHMTDSEYLARDLSNPEHPDADNYAAVCAEPILNHPIVGPGVFRPAHQRLVRRHASHVAGRYPRKG